ncbi:Tyrosine-protein phosphatase Lar, partial [Trichoplax sp. H2]
ISFPSNTNYGGQTYSRNRNLTINLLPNQGFFFQIAQDLTGTIIYSNKDISVLAGNLCANVPTSNRYCEPLQEHYMPSKYLGQNYILSTFTGRAAGDIYRIVAAYDNTTVRLQSASSNYKLSRGEFTQFELASGSDSFLTCDKPCLVVQYAKGNKADLKRADPFMTIVPAIEQYSNNLVITVPSLFTTLNINPNYVLITIQDKYKDGLMLNGKVLQGISWRQVTTNDVSNVYSTASINVPIGTSRLTHNDSSIIYGAIQYGWASGSIGYGSFGDIQWSTMFSYSPRIVQYPTNTFVYEGNMTMLECNGTSSPISTVTWLKDGIVLQNYKNITIIEKFYTYSRLVIPEVSNNDIGNYQCQYNNFLGSATSNKTFIDLIAIPTFERSPSPVFVPINQEIVLQCHGSSNPAAIQLSWIRNSTLLNRYSTSLIVNSSNLRFVGQLKINSSNNEDAGNYKCNISNGYSLALSSDIIVIVQVVLFLIVPFLVPPSSVQQAQASNITATNITISWIPPIFDGYSPIINYTLQLYNHLNSTLNSRCMSSLTEQGCIVTNTLTRLYNLKPYSSYFLHIWASNAIGQSGKEILSIKTDEADTRSMTLIFVFAVVPEGPVRNAYALGYNATTIKVVWELPRRPNGLLGYLVYQWETEYTTNTSIQNSSLIYNGSQTEYYSTNLHESHMYFYKIVAYNIKYNFVGAASEIINATSHEDVPSSHPQSIITTVLSSTSINVSWQPPQILDRNGIIVTYSLRYNSTRWNDNGIIQTTGSNTKVILQNLIPFTTYNITIKAATIVGYGPESPVMSSTTFQSVPNTYPSDINVTTLTSTSIYISWQPIPLFERNGVITVYNISYHSLQRNHNGIIQVDGSTLSNVLSNLLPYTTYNVTVRASTSVGFGPTSPFVSVLTHQSVPNTYPSDINVTTLTSTSIYISWQPIPLFERNGIITVYNISYHSLQWNHSGIIQVDGSTLSNVLSNLLPYTTYNVTVRASTSVGFGPTSPFVSVLTHQSGKILYSNIVFTSCYQLR